MEEEVRVSPLSPADLEQVVRVHIAAFPDSALTKLGRKVVKLFYEWQMFGVEHLVKLGVWDNSGLAGFCIGGATGGSMSGFLRKNRFYLMLHVLSHPWLVLNPIIRDRALLALRLLRRVRTVQSTMPGSPEKRRDSLGILVIAVDPQRQGRGFGRALMDATEAMARQSGFKQMHLTVHPDNVKAIAFYERLGWTKVMDGQQWSGGMRKLLTG